MSIHIDGESVTAATPRLSLTIEKDRLVSLRAGGEEWLVAPVPLVTLLYANDKETPYHARETTVERLNDSAVDLVWDGLAGHVNIRLETHDDDIWVTPCAVTTRFGLKALRLNIGGIDAETELIIPTFQGVKIGKDDPYLRKERLPWPYVWEAAIVFVENRSGHCFYVWTEDTEDRYKAMQLDRESNCVQLGLETENNGPYHDKKEAGGHTWKLSFSQTGWLEGAERYADWLENTWKLREIRSQRASWMENITYALSWCHADIRLLDAIASRIEPGKTLIHFPGWRTDGYDRNYPNYEVNESVRPFLRRAKELGFHTMLHFNVFSISADHPLFRLFSDYQYRDAETMALMAWYTGTDNNNFSTCPQHPLLENFAGPDVLLSYTHAGLTRWRNEITKRVMHIIREEQADCVFLDQTNGLPNLFNSTVEGRTTIRGMQLLLSDLLRLQPGLIIGGEGLNEVTMRHQGVAQLHLFKSHRESVPGLEKIAFRVCDILYRGHTKLIAYCNNDGHDEASELRIRVHEKLGGIPSMTLNDRPATDLTDPNGAVRELFERAKQWKPMP